MNSSRKHSFQQILFRKPFKFLADTGKVFPDLTLIDLYALKAVGKIIELFLNNMFRSRNLEIFKVLSYLVFNEPYLVLLAGYIIATETPVLLARPVRPLLCV